MDMKETMAIMIRVMQTLGREHAFGGNLAELLDVKNCREQKAYATAIRTKSEAFEQLHEALETIKQGGWLSLDKGYNQVHASSMIVSRNPMSQSGSSQSIMTKQMIQVRPVNTIDEIDDEEQFDEYGNNKNNPSSPTNQFNKQSLAGRMLMLEESKASSPKNQEETQQDSPFNANIENSLHNNHQNSGQASASLKPHLKHEVKRFESVDQLQLAGPKNFNKAQSTAVLPQNRNKYH